MTCPDMACRECDTGNKSCIYKEHHNSYIHIFLLLSSVQCFICLAKQMESKSKDLLKKGKKGKRTFMPGFLGGGG